MFPKPIVKVFGPPAVSRPGFFRRLQIHRRGPQRRQRPARNCKIRPNAFIAASRPNPKDPATLEPDAPQSKIAGLFTVFRANSPQLYVDLNRDQCQTMGVNPSDVFTTLQVYLGSLYTSTTSTSSAGPGRWSCRRDGEFRDDSRESQTAQGAQFAQRAWCRWAPS